jgi:hypothetical protein
VAEEEEEEEEDALRALFAANGSNAAAWWANFDARDVSARARVGARAVAGVAIDAIIACSRGRLVRGRAPANVGVAVARGK